ncbi:MAG: hypothetical protein JRH15_16415, partial [Deltaproteobacteria bacterium]|nr:hypothetical protein [Deltaproteobacteria bacterium]
METKPNFGARFFNHIPLVSTVARLRGWPYIISWIHRITGVMLVLFSGYHIYTLQSLSTPAVYNAKMQLLGSPLFVLLEWALAIPVMFHALNGGRLILFESFRVRNDSGLIRWVIALLILYCAALGLLMAMGNQRVSAPFFWLMALTAGATITARGAQQILYTKHAVTWKLQRLTGLFLIVMIPAHFLFMHLNPTMAKEAETVLMRLAHPFIKFIDICL